MLPEPHNRSEEEERDEKKGKRELKVHWKQG